MLAEGGQAEVVAVAERIGQPHDAPSGGRAGLARAHGGGFGAVQRRVQAGDDQVQTQRRPVARTVTPASGGGAAGGLLQRTRRHAGTGQFQATAAEAPARRQPEAATENVSAGAGSGTSRGLGRRVLIGPGAGARSVAS